MHIGCIVTHVDASEDAIRQVDLTVLPMKKAVHNDSITVFFIIIIIIIIIISISSNSSSSSNISSSSGGSRCSSGGGGSSGSSSSRIGIPIIYYSFYFKLH